MHNNIVIDYTGRTLTPASLSTTGAITGWESIGPMIGIDLRNWTITPKKSPKSPTIPSDSIIKPRNVCFISIKRIPKTKKMDPRLLFGLEKNIKVFWVPMINMTPIRKRIFPRASRARSKKVKMPITKNRNPPKVNATPNSVW